MADEIIEIHVVQAQNRHGTWELHGPAFLDEESCRQYVYELDIRWILETVPDDLIVEKLFGIAEGEFSGSIESELRKIPRDELNDHLDDEEGIGQCGGVHSWETLELKDGLDIHARRNAG